MNYSTYRFTLDIQSDISQVSLPVKLNDTGRRLLIGLTDGGNPYHISEGSLAVFSYSKKEPNADGTYESGIFDCIIEDNYNTVRFDLLPEVTSVAGVVDCEIWLYGANGRQLTSPRFILVVDERVMSASDYPLPEDKLSVLDSILVSEAGRAEAEAKRVEAETAREEACQELIGNTEAYCREAIDNANSAVRSAGQAVDSANSAVNRLNDKLNEIYPTPTINEEKKLTEAGYYAVYVFYSSIIINFGTFYYRQHSLGQSIYSGDYRLLISADGSMVLQSIARSVSNDGKVVYTYTDFPHYHSFYTAKL